MNIKTTILCLFIYFPIMIQAQTFTRVEYPFPMDNPWEIIYGPDNFLWVSEKSGTVSRVNPLTGLKSVVYTAPDFATGEPSEKALCGRNIGSGTFGLALHPDFLDPDSSFIYYIYSYNSGTQSNPATRFKIVKLTWDASSSSVVANEDLLTELPNGYDHFGYRLIAVKQNEHNYLYFSVGDMGSNDPACYNSPNDNPNNFAQDPFTQNGKIHRVNINGTVPIDNPIPGNLFFTRGHRNPQGLAYNPGQNVVYGIEHGHTTDDEVNVLESGMNYGWKDVQGYHDGNYAGEMDYVQNYTPNTNIPNDRLVEPLFSWGTVEDTSGSYLDWPTVAPSDGIYYGSNGIPEWTNSLLVVTLKNGTNTDQAVIQLKLKEDGTTLADSTPGNPNPKAFFEADHEQNGRIRDIAISPDGKKIYLITNNRNEHPNPIIEYTYEETNSIEDLISQSIHSVKVYPNPFSTQTHIEYEIKTAGKLKIEITDVLGKHIKTLHDQSVLPGRSQQIWDGTDKQGRKVPGGMYFYTVSINNVSKSSKVFLVK